MLIKNNLNSLNIIDNNDEDENKRKKEKFGDSKHILVEFIIVLLFQI